MRHKSILFVASLATAIVAGGSRSKADLVTIPATVTALTFDLGRFTVEPFPTELGTLQALTLSLRVTGLTHEDFGDPEEPHFVSVTHRSPLLLAEPLVTIGWIDPSPGGFLDMHRHPFSASTTHELSSPAALAAFTAGPVRFELESVDVFALNYSHFHGLEWGTEHVEVNGYFTYTAVPEARSWLAMGVIGTSIFGHRRIQLGIKKSISSAVD